MYGDLSLNFGDTFLIRECSLNLFVKNSNLETGMSIQKLDLLGGAFRTLDGSHRCEA